MMEVKFKYLSVQSVKVRSSHLCVAAKTWRVLSKMNNAEFRKSLEANGFTVVERQVPPNSSLEEHEHDWKVKAMITEVSFYVHTASLQKTYIQGEVFELISNEPHTEGAGEHGASLLIGRKS